MTEKLIERTVDLMIEEQLVLEKKKEDYVYTLTCMLESIITLTTIVILSFFFKNTIHTIGFLWFFFFLRKRTGGYHAETFFGCFLSTVIIYIGLVPVCRIFLQYPMLRWMMLIVTCCVIFVIGGVNHPNMNMDKEEFESAKNSARLALILEIMIIGFFKWLHTAEIFVTYLSVAVLLCGILLCVAKMIGQEVKKDE